jgi:hypothetical protein
MKRFKVLTIIFVITASLNIGYSQVAVYEPFLDTNGVWKEGIDPSQFHGLWKVESKVNTFVAIGKNSIQVFKITPKTKPNVDIIGEYLFFVDPFEKKRIVLIDNSGYVINLTKTEMSLSIRNGKSNETWYLKRASKEEINLWNKIQIIRVEGFPIYEPFLDASGIWEKGVAPRQFYGVWRLEKMKKKGNPFPYKYGKIKFFFAIEEKSVIFFKVISKTKVELISRYLFSVDSLEKRRIVFNSSKEEGYIRRLTNTRMITKLIGTISEQTWYLKRASEKEIDLWNKTVEATLIARIDREKRVKEEVEKREKEEIERLEKEEKRIKAEEKRIKEERQAQIRAQQEKQEREIRAQQGEYEIEIKLSKYEPRVRELIRQRRINLGFTKEQVELSWGEPERINRTVGRWGVHEQWVYGHTYVYFEDGILTSWQD